MIRLWVCILACMADAVKLGINFNAEKGEVMDTFRLLADEGITMIAVVHEVPFVREATGRVAFFHWESFAGSGPPRS